MLVPQKPNSEKDKMEEMNNSRIKLMTKEAYELIREVYGPFFPTPNGKREAFMDMVREKVNYYKPMIEEKCKINFGEVKVKDNKEWLPDLLYGSAPMLALKYAWKQGRTPTKMDYNLSFITSSFAEILFFPPIWLFNTFLGADFRHNDNTIYVPFNYMNRFMDIDFKRRIRDMDYGVIHELSHGLWDKLAGEELFKRDGCGLGERRRWFEGFATYCAEDFFAEFYPDEAKKTYTPPKLYREGKKKIEEVVNRYGEKILLEIPRRWKELGLELSENQKSCV